MNLPEHPENPVPDYRYMDRLQIAEQIDFYVAVVPGLIEDATRHGRATARNAFLGVCGFAGAVMTGLSLLSPESRSPWQAVGLAASAAVAAGGLKRALGHERLGTAAFDEARNALDQVHGMRSLYKEET